MHCIFWKRDGKVGYERSRMREGGKRGWMKVGNSLMKRASQEMNGSQLSLWALLPVPSPLRVKGWKSNGPPFPLLSRSCSNSCPLSWWCHPTISSSVTSFSSCPQSFLASRSFPLSWLFPSSGQNIGASASASASVLPMNIQDWFPLELTGLISLLSKGL